MLLTTDNVVRPVVTSTIDDEDNNSPCPAVPSTATTTLQAYMQLQLLILTNTARTLMQCLDQTNVERGVKQRTDAGIEPNLLVYSLSRSFSHLKPSSPNPPRLSHQLIIR